MFFLTELQDLRHATRPISRTNEISWISVSFIDKVIGTESGEKDFELVRLQEDSLNIRCEHFLLLTFCHVLFLKGRLFDCLLIH